MAIGETRFTLPLGEADGPQRIVFVVLPHFTMTALASAIDPLHVANRITGRKLFDWTIRSVDGRSVRSGNGMSIEAEGSLEQVAEADVVVVASGANVEKLDLSPVLGMKLREMSARGAALGSLCTGAYVLARFNLLNGYRCTIHWEDMRALREAFPELDVTNDIFEIDRNRLTCAGGTASLDMMLMYVGMSHGVALARSVAEILLHEKIRTGDEPQRYDLASRLGTDNRVLLEAVAIMDAHIEDPLSCRQLAMVMNVSPRQLERVFRKHVDCSPGQYYLQLRLRAARDLLRQTRGSVVDTAVACGFASTSHFTQCYRNRYGHTPSQEKQLSIFAASAGPPMTEAIAVGA